MCYSSSVEMRTRSVATGQLSTLPLERVSLRQWAPWRYPLCVVKRGGYASRYYLRQKSFAGRGRLRLFV
jgi:hypothetical protein